MQNLGKRIPISECITILSLKGISNAEATIFNLLEDGSIRAFGIFAGENEKTEIDKSIWTRRASNWKFMDGIVWINRRDRNSSSMDRIRDIEVVKYEFDSLISKYNSELLPNSSEFSKNSAHENSNFEILRDTFNNLDKKKPGPTKGSTRNPGDKALVGAAISLMESENIGPEAAIRKVAPYEPSDAYRRLVERLRKQIREAKKV